MGWQDAPLASPTGPKPGWASAPLATQSHAPAGGAAPEDPRENGDYFSGDGLLSKVGNFIHRADIASNRGAHALVGGLERTGQTVANTIGLDGIGNYLGSDAALEEQHAAAPVPGATSWEDVKADPSVSNIGSFIGEQAGAALPSLGAAAVALPAFAASRLGEVGHTRAVNSQQLNLSDLMTGQDHRQQTDVAATVMDLLKAAPSAAVDTVLMKGGLSGILSGSLPKAIAREGIAQAGMPVADYAGETVGTNVPFDPAEAGNRAAAGLVAGIPLGAGAHLGVRGTRALRELYAVKGVDTSKMSDEALTEGSLNGSIHPDIGADQVDQILQTVGSRAEHFSTPERAAAAAAKVQPAPAQGHISPDVVSGLRAHGIPEHIARGVAAGVFAESGNRHDAVNPDSGALGYGQWLGSRKAELERRFGPNPTHEQQIEFLANELKGGDSGGKFVLRAGNEADALNAYITKFMRPAAGKETDGDLKRGAEALGISPRETVYRAPAPADEPFRSDSGFERTDAEQKPTEEELGAKGARYDNMATGDSSAPFREATDNPEGQPGYWEHRAEMHAEDLRKEWEASRKEPPPTSEDPGSKYGANNYGQRPHRETDAHPFATTGDGHIADVNGKPVAFRNIKDAAKFAAKNKLGGDFEPKVWAANSARVVLSKRPGSSYGERASRPEGPQEPPAGRTADESQRLIPDWQKAPLDGPPAREKGPDLSRSPEEAKTAPAAGKGPSRADDGYIVNPQVPRETENVPAGSERFDEVPAARAEPHSVEPPPEDRTQKMADQIRGYWSSQKNGGFRRKPIQVVVTSDGRIKGWAASATERAVDHKFNADDGDTIVRLKPDDEQGLLGAIAGHRTAARPSNGNPAPVIQAGHVLPEASPPTLGRTGAADRASPEAVAAAGAEENRARPSRSSEAGQRAPEDHLGSGGEPERIPTDENGGAPHVNREGDRVREPVPAEHSGEKDVEGVRAPRAGTSGLKPGAKAPSEEGAESNASNPTPKAAENGQKPPSKTEETASANPTPPEERAGNEYGQTNRLVTREDYEKAGKTIRDAGNKASSGVDPAAVGAVAKEAAFHVEASARKLADMLLEKDADPAELIRAARDMVKSPEKTTKGLLKSLDRFGAAVAYSSDGALRTLARHYKSPTIAKLADMFQARAGAPDATSRTYDEALKRQNGRFRSRLDSALDPFMSSKPAMERIRDLLTEPDRSVRATAKEREAAKTVRDLLKDVVAYRKEAGEDIGEVKDYFPRVVDSIAVANNPGKFKTAAERLYRDLGVEDPAAAAEAWMVRVLDTHAGLDGGEEFIVASGKPSSSKSREFGPKADELLRDFLQKDPLLVLSDYVTGSVRRAEQTRRFGPKGAFDSTARGDWVKEHGTKSQWDVMLDDIRSELRSSGEDADGVVRQVKTIRDGVMGRLGTAGVRVSRAVSTIHAWNQLSTLQKVTLSSIGDLAMGFVRGGPTYGVRHFTTSLKEAAKLVETFGKRDLSDAHRWAEAMGTVGHGTASQLIQARMDAAPGAVQHAALLNKFYHKVGIEQLTQGGRVAATENAKIFLDTLSGDLLSKSSRTRQRATLYLKELGIKDPQVFGEWLRKGAPSAEALAADRGHAADYATAVVRFADQTILMPSRAQKPSWANHPVGSLVFALQSYNAAFTQNVLKRVGRLGVEAVKSKDPALLIPALGLTVLVGMNALQTYLRTAIFGGKGPDDDKQFGLQVLDRAGLTGMASPIFNAMLGLKYHRSVSQSLQGSVLGRAGQAVDAVGGLAIGNSANTNTAERKAAGLLYDLVIDPAANAFGAKYIKGAAGTSLILGTGNRAGGALPGDRDAFIDAVAGEKKRVSS